MLNKETGRINWNNSAKDIHNLVRGLNPWPIAHTTYEEQTMKIYKSTVINEQSDKDPGTIIRVDKEGVKVSCLEGILLIEIVQFPNGKPLTIEQYINGKHYKRKY